MLPGAAPSKIRDNVQTSVTPPKEIPQPKTDVYLASPVSESLIKSESHVENYENLGGTEVLHSMTKVSNLKQRFLTFFKWRTKFEKDVHVATPKTVKNVYCYILNRIFKKSSILQVSF